LNLNFEEKVLGGDQTREDAGKRDRDKYTDGEKK